MDTNSSELIDLLGGTAAVAALCEITPGAVSQWRTSKITKARLMYLQLKRPGAFPKPVKARKKGE